MAVLEQAGEQTTLLTHLTTEAQRNFTYWFLRRLQFDKSSIRLEGQNYFEFLKSHVRREKWDC